MRIRNSRGGRRPLRHIPLPASTTEDAAQGSAETLSGLTRHARQTAPLSREVTQPLIEYVLQELLARLVADLPTQCVIHVSLNARGSGQFELRRTYPTLDVAKAQARGDIADLVRAIRAGLQDSGATLACDGRVGQ